MHKTWLVILLLAFSIKGFGQFEIDTGPKLTANGYLKYLQTIAFVDGLDSIVLDNLIHHRLNFKWYTSKTITTVVEFRNRIFYGEVVRAAQPNFTDFLEEEDFFNLSVTLVDKESLVIHSVIDRGYVNWAHKNTEITLGRQRINWGINTVWNPNDLFNVFSYLDFDYEERPGSDAFRFKHYGKKSTSIDVAIKAIRDLEALVAAAMYKFKVKRYDLQLLGGVWREDIAIGGGWAGHIGGTGFKGEMTYFHPYENFSDTTGSLSAAISFDYIFPSTLYINGSYLFNGSGSSSASAEDLLTFELNAKSLSPYKHTFFATAGYPFSPIFSGGIAMIYEPGNHTLFLNPTLTISIAENWDLDFIGQLFWSSVNNSYKGVGQLVFWRLKWSY